MYLPPAFAETDPIVITEIVANHSLAQVVVVGPDGLVATPVPMLVRGEVGVDGWSLVGHLAKANPVLVAVGLRNETGTRASGADVELRDRAGAR
jgi:predicted FMN-binding regulatory protein PaiB